MATWKRANEAYFGDTFDRDVTLCNAAIAYDTASDSDCTAIKAINWNDNNTATFTCNDVVINKETSDSLYNCVKAYAIKSDVETVSDRLYELQAQINDLKKNLEMKKENSELRSALKTLHYKREVE